MRRATLALALSAALGCAPESAVPPEPPDASPERSPLTFLLRGYRGGAWQNFTLADMQGTQDRYLLVHGAGYW